MRLVIHISRPFLATPRFTPSIPRTSFAATTNNFADYEKGDWAQTIVKDIGRGVLVNDVDKWHASRTLLKPLFRRNRAADVRMFEPHVSRLVGYLRRHEGEFKFSDLQNM